MKMKASQVCKFLLERKIELTFIDEDNYFFSKLWVLTLVEEWKEHRLLHIQNS